MQIKVSVGKTKFNGFGLEKLNLKIDKHGFIETNENFQTSQYQTFMQLVM